jgi:hypothetical protein
MEFKGKGEYKCFHNLSMGLKKRVSTSGTAGDFITKVSNLTITE